MEKTSYLLAGSGILATKRRIFGRKVIRGGGNALPLERIVEPYHGMIEWPGLKRTTVIMEFELPCCVQCRQPLDHAFLLRFDLKPASLLDLKPSSLLPSGFWCRKNCLMSFWPASPLRFGFHTRKTPAFCVAHQQATFL